MKNAAKSLTGLRKQFGVLVTKSFLPLSNNPNYRNFFFSSLLVNIGFWIQNTTQIWLVLEITGSGKMVGLLTICQFGPLVVFGLFGGVIVDKYDRRITLLVTESGLMLTTAALAILALTGRATVPVVMTVAIIRSLLYCVNTPVKQTFALDVIGNKNVANALALNATGGNIARIFGSAISGAMISYLGAGLCFAANALSYIGMIVTVIRIPPKTDSLHPKAIGLSPVASLFEALGAVRRNAKLSVLVTALLGICFIPLSFATVLPIFVLKTLGRDPTVYGVMFSCIGIGSLAGAILMTGVSRATPIGLFGAAAGIGVTQALLVFVRSVPTTCLMLVFVGVCMTVFLVGINSILLADTEEAMRGRISGLYAYIVAGVGPLGTSISGWLCEVGGTNLAFATGAAISFIVAIFGYLLYRAAISRQKPLPT